MTHYNSIRPSGAASEKAQSFLNISNQFRLGDLVTESSHPRDRNLSTVASDDSSEGLRLLFDVDQDVVDKFEEWSQSGVPEQAAAEVAKIIWNGGKLFLTGCGSTGRLSIQLASIWRRYWRDLGKSGEIAPDVAAEWENRAWSVMAGGDFALIKAVEGFEDYTAFGKQQIEDLGLNQDDVVFAITEGGETSFVIGTAWKGVEKGAKVFFVYNNPDDVLGKTVQRSREIIDEERIQKINLTTGPMAISGSTRMQATSIQLISMLAILELVLDDLTARLTSKTEDPNAPARILEELRSGLKTTHSSLKDPGFRDQLAKLVEREEQIYRAKKRNNYFADNLGIDVLTDTTERSPTFCIPAFRQFDNDNAAESWSFLFLPYEKTDTAWKELLQRDIRAVEWDRPVLERLLDAEELERQEKVIRTITRESLLRFRIGKDGLGQRPPRPGDGATAILTAEDLPLLFAEDGFFREQLQQAHEAGASTSLIFAGTTSEIEKVKTFLQEWSVPVVAVYLQVPETNLRLNPARRVGIKMLLNALSTLTMVRMGRVFGNFMIWVVPSNLKLIDRSTRYIQQLTDLGYEEACHLLHEAMEYVEPRIAAGIEYPALVGLVVTAINEKCGFEEAERKLQENSPR